MLPGSEREDVERGGKSKSPFYFCILYYYFTIHHDFSYNASICSGYIDPIKYQLSDAVQAHQ